jgi:hypothetical protein
VVPPDGMPGKFVVHGCIISIWHCTRVLCS